MDPIGIWALLKRRLTLESLLVKPRVPTLSGKKWSDFANELALNPLLKIIDDNISIL